MELVEFTPDNCVWTSGKTNVPVIHFQLKNGSLQFNKAAELKLGIKEGDHLKVLQDPDDKSNWYFEKVKDGGFVIRSKTSGKYTNLFFSNKMLALKMAESVEFTGNNGKMLIAGQPTKVDKRILWGIILTRLID